MQEFVIVGLVVGAAAAAVFLKNANRERPVRGDLVMRASDPDDARLYGAQQLVALERRRWGSTSTTRSLQAMAAERGRTTIQHAASAVRGRAGGETTITQSMRAHPREAAEAGRGYRLDHTHGRGRGVRAENADVKRFQAKRNMQNREAAAKGGKDSYMHMSLSDDGYTGTWVRRSVRGDSKAKRGKR